MDFYFSTREKLFIWKVRSLRCSLIDRRTGGTRQLLRLLREKNYFCISSKRVAPVKYSRQKKLCSWNSLSSLSKQETRVNLLEYQELISAPWGVFIVDQLG